MSRSYWKLWTASTISNLGGGVAGTAFPLLAASLTHDPKDVAGLTVAFTLPWLLFGLMAGALVDRLDRRRVMVSVNAVRAVLMGLLAASVFAGEATIPLLYGFAFLLGTGETLFDNAAQSILPAIVPRERLEDANGRLAAAERVTNEFAGPPIGGILFGLAAATPFLVDSSAFVVSVLLVLAIPGSFRAAREAVAPTTLLAEIREGLRWLARERTLRAVAASVSVLGLVDSAWFSILVLYALEILDLGSAGFGALLVAGGVGSVIGSIAAARLSRRLGPPAALAGALLLAAASQVALGVTSSVGVAAAMLAVSGVAFGIWNVVAVSLRQALTPDRLLGRVHSSYRFLGIGATALGAVAGGLTADAFGLRAPFLIGAPLLFLTAAALYGTTARKTITPPI